MNTAGTAMVNLGSVDIFYYALHKAPIFCVPLLIYLYVNCAARKNNGV